MSLLPHTAIVCCNPGVCVKQPMARIMTTVTINCKSIRCIQVQFAKHLKAKCKNVHPELNKAHVLSIDDLHDPFTDDTRTQLQPLCIKMIWEKAMSAIEQHAAKDGKDPTKAPSWFNGSLHSCQELESGQAMRQNNDTLHTLNMALEKKHNPMRPAWKMRPKHKILKPSHS